MRKWYLPANPEDLNDATEYYVRTLEAAGDRLGVSLVRVRSVRDIPFRADVLAIDCKIAFKVLLARPLCRTWLWVQGIVPEESALHFGDTPRNKLRQLYWTAFERVSIPRARGVVLVSNAMRRHYAKKYGFTRLPAFVMPCVNQEVNDGAFAVRGKYSSPTFVYAGSMHRWQCFELTLDVFRRVREVRSDARLTVLTGDERAARKAVADVGLHHVEVTRVPLERLQETLRAYKYGFVLREAHVVNEVATPTKLSSYMAAGVIPITTTAMHDYAERLGPLANVVMCPTADPVDIADRILAFEERTVSPDGVLAEYRRVFEDYLAHRRYLPALAEFLRQTGLSGSATVGLAEGSSSGLTP